MSPRYSQPGTGGNLEARDRLITLVYDEMRRRAAAFIRRERSGRTLQPAALVHEVYLRLVNQNRAVWLNRAQFLAIASEMTRYRTMCVLEGR